MRQFPLLPALIALCLLAAPAARALDKEVECPIQADVVTQIVAARTSGASADLAVVEVGAALDEAAAKYATILPSLVDWVYALPEEQMGERVAQSWSEACMAQ